MLVAISAVTVLTSLFGAGAVIGVMHESARVARRPQPTRR